MKIRIASYAIRCKCLEGRYIASSGHICKNIMIAVVCILSCIQLVVCNVAANGDDEEDLPSLSRFGATRKHPRYFCPPVPVLWLCISLFHFRHIFEDLGYNSVASMKFMT